MSEDGQLNVWESDTDLDGLKPFEEPDKGDKRIEVSDEEETDSEGVTDKNKQSGNPMWCATWKIVIIQSKVPVQPP